MKKVCITEIPVGTRFSYIDREGKKNEWEVVCRDEYPFIEAKCLSEKHEYNTLFWDFDIVEVADDTRVYKQSFVNVGNNYFVRKEELV